MIAVIYAILSFVLALGVLIAVHEYGHFWMARRMGVKVLRFAIGFGKPLWSATRGPDQTEYVLGMLPLGGYVKMLDEREGPVAVHEAHRAFNRQGVWPRIAIVSAGPLANFLFAIVLYWGMFMVGMPGIKTIVDRVTPASVAERADLQHGDEIIAVAGDQTPTMEVLRLSLVEAALNKEVVEISVRRDGQERKLAMDLSAVPMKMIENGLLQEIGIIPLQPHLPAIVGQLEVGSVAERAGLTPGDVIVSVDGIGVGDWIAWAEYIRAHAEKSIQVVVRRDGVEKTLSITPAAVHTKQGTIGRIGAAPRPLDEFPEQLMAKQQYGVAAAFWQGIKKTADISLLTLRMLGKMVVGEASIENLSGPISIAQYAGQSAQIGILPFIAFLAIISISLGVLNLLPVPVLDGGHLLFYGIELIKGSPVSDKILLLGQKIGVVLLIGLMILAFYNDLARVFG
ncbi:MAG: RIP metalloprotease RseP [Pseudomonadota bacterium]